MRKIKIIFSLIIGGIAPYISLFLMPFANKEITKEICKHRVCPWEFCEDKVCKSYRTITKIESMNLFNAIKEHPWLVILLILLLVFYIMYVISLKRNAYTYIGYSDLGKMGIISIGLYLALSLIIVFSAMLMYKQVGMGPLTTMFVMFLVPFIIRPIVVDW